MHELGIARIAQPRGDLAALRAHQPQRFGGRVVAQAARHLEAVGTEADDQVAALEVSLHALHADRQQTLAGLPKHARRTLVEVQPPARLHLACDPALARRHRPGRGAEQGTDRLTARDGEQCFGLAAVGDHGRSTRARRRVGGIELGAHAAAAESALALAGHADELRIGEVGLADELGVGITAWIAIEQTFLIREDHQQVGLDEIHRQRAERVVVAQADLVGGDRVVFVDDRHHAELEQGVEGATGVEVAAAVGDILVREQHLCGLEPVLLELGLISAHETHLADGGGGLQLVQGLGPLLEAQARHAFGDGAGRHQHDLLALPSQLGDLRAPVGDGDAIQPLPLGGDQRAANLDDSSGARGLRCDSTHCMACSQSAFTPAPVAAEMTKCRPLKRRRLSDFFTSASSTSAGSVSDLLNTSHCVRPATSSLNSVSSARMVLM